MFVAAGHFNNVPAPLGAVFISLLWSEIYFSIRFYKHIAPSGARNHVRN